MLSREVGREPHRAVRERSVRPDAASCRGGEVAEVDGVAAVAPLTAIVTCSAPGSGAFGIPLAEHAEPPAEVAAAVAPRADGRAGRRRGRRAARSAAARPRSACRTTRRRRPGPRRRAAGPGCGSRWSGTAAAPRPRAGSAGSAAAGTGRSPRPRSVASMCRRSSRRGSRAGRRSSEPTCTSTPQRIGAAIFSA